MDWVLTIPKTTKWVDYEKELAAVADGSQVMNYRSRYIPKEMSEGDRCYLVHDGKVRGWMNVVGMVDMESPWTCSTTGQQWPAGKYIQRSGPFHRVDGPEMKGFRGIRKYQGPSPAKVASDWVNGVDQVYNSSSERINVKGGSHG
jgi:hypothetical protein